MAKLTTNDKEILEELFQMRGGYVLNFSDRTFGEFFQNDMALNIFDPKYNYASGSKANRLRGFWQVADAFRLSHPSLVQKRTAQTFRNEAVDASELWAAVLVRWPAGLAGIKIVLSRRL